MGKRRLFGNPGNRDFKEMTLLSTLINTLKQKDLERCPVMDGDKIVRIITIKDIMRGHKKIMDLKRKYFK